MTPEELNRTIEFIVASQARLAAAQEQDRQDRIEFEQWAKNLMTRLARVSEENARLLTHQSDRMDRMEERMDRMDKVHENWSRQNAQILRILKQLLDRLPPFPPNPN